MYLLGEECGQEGHAEAHAFAVGQPPSCTGYLYLYLLGEESGQEGHAEAHTGAVGGQHVAVHGLGPADRALLHVQRGNVHLPGLARLVDEDDGAQQ